MTFENQTINQAGQDQLERVAAEFDHWRDKKTARAEKIPISLLREAQKLSEHYKATEVRRRLGLTKTQMDKLEQPQPPEDSSDFMRLVPHAESSVLPALTIEITTPQGAKICLSGFSQQDPLALIAKFIET